jgi:hypothetical protein
MILHAFGVPLPDYMRPAIAPVVLPQEQAGA